MRFFYCFIFSLLILTIQTNTFASSTFDNAEESSTSTRELATKELSKKTTTYSDLSSKIQVNDLYQDPYQRDFLYFTQIKLQSFQWGGRIALPVAGSVDLSTSPSSVMPTIEIGSIYKMDETTDFKMNWGLIGGLSYSTTSQDITTDSRFIIDNVRTNTVIAQFGGTLYIEPKRYSLLDFFISPRIGVASFNQSSSNELANFSQQMTFNSIGVGTHIRLIQNLSILAQWTHISMNQKNSDLEMPQQTFEMGVTRKW